MLSLRKLLGIVTLGVGIFAGVGAATFHYAEGTSYLSADPRACANCHIMESYFDSWQKASHHTVATCVECHLPTDFIGKYWAKAENGWLHSKAFTLQDFPEPLRITPKNAAILQANCERCHADLLHGQLAGGSLACVHCHADVGHGERTGLGGALRDDEIPPHGHTPPEER